jgi:predicted DNA-binding protein
MLKTQIYLTATEKKELNLLSEETGKSQSELIHEPKNGS